MTSQNARTRLAALVGSVALAFALAPPPASAGLIATTLTVTVEPAVVFVGEAATVTFQVNPLPDGGSITLGGPGIRVDPATGRAELQLTYDSAGTKPVEAWFSGTDAFAASPIAKGSVQVIRRVVTASLTGPQAAVGRGDPVELLLDLDNPPDGGQVAIQDMTSGNPGPTLLWVSGLTGAMPMSLEVPGLPPGKYHLRAAFSGTAAYAPAVSEAVVVDVFDRTTELTLEVDPPTPLWGEPSTATVSFDPVPDDEGMVRLVVDGAGRGWFVMDWGTGTGSMDLPWLDPGSHLVRAEFVPAGYLVTRWAAGARELELEVSGTPLETDAPVGWVEIDDGATVAHDSYVVVSMDAQDASPIVDVKMSQRVHGRCDM